MSEQKPEEIIAQAVIEEPKIEETKTEEIIAQPVTETPKIEETKTDVEKVPESCNDEPKLLSNVDDQLNQIKLENNELNAKINKLERDLEARTEERENYKNKIDGLESEIAELKKQQPNTLSPAQQNEIEKIKKRSEDMLTKAKGIIFDKTKICKNQELQIEAFKQQVVALKDVLGITKNLLEIRNVEVKHLQEKMECMEIKIGAERQRQDLLCKKMDAVTTMNDNLKEEYQKQLVMFEEMQKSYE